MSTTRFAQDNVDIRGRFKSAFADVPANAAIRVIWESQPEDYNGDPFPDVQSEFVKIIIRQNTSRQVSVGGRGSVIHGRRFRHYGTVAVYIQTAANKGTKENERVADLVGQAFSALSLGNVVFRDATYRQSGASAGQWFRGIVSVPYQSTFDE